jgi:hypothetical protein
MCNVSDRVRSIANAYCKNVLRRPCPKLPCVLVHQSSTSDIRIRTQLNGQIINAKDVKTKTNASKAIYIECIKSPALDLFTHGPPYPSLRIDGKSRIENKLFGNVLTLHYRSPESIWGLYFNWESIGYFPWSGDKSILSFFDITQGYDRHLYDTILDGHLMPHVSSLLTDNRVSFSSAISSKNQTPSYITAPTLWMNENCYAVSNRSGYMKEIMSYMPVDAWGKCGKNKGPELPPEILKIQGSNHTESHFRGNWELSKAAMMKNYLFTVAIENSFEHDYITEKLWQPLSAGSVPLYYGAPNVYEWLPCNDCIIDLRNFANPRAAAEYIMAISKNTTRYAELHKWREHPLLPKFQKILDYFKRASVYSLDSIMCAMAHSKNPQLTRFEILEDIGPVFSTKE